MDVRVKGRALQKVAESEKEARRKFGDKAKKLRARLDDLDAAPTLGDLPAALHPHPLNGQRAGQFAVSVADGVRIVFTPRQPLQKDKDGNVNWRAVDAIDVVFIGDYH